MKMSEEEIDSVFQILKKDMDLESFREKLSPEQFEIVSKIIELLKEKTKDMSPEQSLEFITQLRTILVKD